MARLDCLTQDTKIALAASVEERQKTPRWGYRLKASTIAGECDRQIWALFRWMYTPEPTKDRMVRIFDIGHYIEERMIEDFRQMPGVMVKDREHDKDDQPTDKQIGVSFADGHGFGYVDALLYGLPEAPKTVHVLEVKSMKNTDFNAVQKHGVKDKKPLHYGQFQIYMHKMGYTRALYGYECKNTSNRDFSRIEYDFDYSTSLEAKAERIAFAEHPPEPFSLDPEHFVCRFCEVKAWCHKLTADLPPKNCRTCAHVTPISGGNWVCSCKGPAWLSRDQQEKGCGKHLYNPGMVNGKVTGGDGENSVIYEMVDGSTYVDHVQEGE